MHIKFLRGYQGVLTHEQWYEAGDMAELPNGHAIVAEGAAEPVIIEARAGQVSPAPPEMPPVARPVPRRQKVDDDG